MNICLYLESEKLMINIEKIKIERFRSILKLELSIETSFNLVSICGQNNVGKTNTLRAINLFFNPEEYDIFLDRPVLKQAQGGASIDPTITITFFNSDNSFYYEISRSLKEYKENQRMSGLKGYKYKKKITKKSSKIELKNELKNDEISSLLNKIRFRYIESININIPKLIEELTENIIDVEYDKSRLSNSKKELSDAYKKYTEGLQEILDIFSDKISETFNNFKSEWDIKFHVPSSVQTFRDLISNDVELRIDDRGGFNTKQKGSGLQRLAVILLNFEILKRIKNKNHVICIDEPDIYLHEGLQKKLKKFFEENSQSVQIFYTTHSKVFIDSYLLRNVHLLDVEIEKKPVARKNNRIIDVIKTKYVHLDTDEGYDKICENLGIEKNNYEILKKKNILVEGECDKKYLEEFGNYFGLEIPNIIPLYGVSNIEKYLNFYNAYYRNNVNNYIPKVKILFDNDNAGREQYRKIEKKYNKEAYKYIEVELVLIKKFLGNSKVDMKNNNDNHEIEDMIYPEIICYLVNKMLDKRKFNSVSVKEINKKISEPSFSSNGIFNLIENEKNEKNLKDGNKISFISSGENTNQIKEGMARMFNILGDRKLIDIIEKNRKEYPFVEKFIKELFDF